MFILLDCANNYHITKELLLTATVILINISASHLAMKIKQTFPYSAQAAHATPTTVGPRIAFAKYTPRGPVVAKIPAKNSPVATAAAPHSNQFGKELPPVSSCI
jgi:hypothetical protein